MHLERRTVSRKTPGDGRLEISQQAADRLRSVGADLQVSLDGLRALAVVETMSCTCHGKDTPHQHHFLQSATFSQLVPGATVDIELNAAIASVCVVESRST